MYRDLSFELQTQTFNCLVGSSTQVFLRHLKSNMSQIKPSSVLPPPITQARKPREPTLFFSLLPKPNQSPSPSYSLSLTQLTLVPLLFTSRSPPHLLTYSAISTPALPQSPARTPSNHVCKSLSVVFLGKISSCHSTAHFTCQSLSQLEIQQGTKQINSIFMEFTVQNHLVFSGRNKKVTVFNSGCRGGSIDNLEGAVSSYSLSHCMKNLLFRFIMLLLFAAPSFPPQNRGTPSLLGPLTACTTLGSDCYLQICLPITL